MSSSSDSKDPQKTGSTANQKPEARSDCPVHPSTFGAFRQAVVDTGNSILCKTVRSPDSEKCKKINVDPKGPCTDAGMSTGYPPRAERRADDAPHQDKTALPGGNGECRCAKPPAQEEKMMKSTNPNNPTTPEKTLEIVKFFTDDGR